MALTVVTEKIEESQRLGGAGVGGSIGLAVAPQKTNSRTIVWANLGPLLSNKWQFSTIDNKIGIGESSLILLLLFIVLSYCLSMGSDS